MDLDSKQAKAIAYDLLTRNKASFERLLTEAGSSADSMRLAIQRIAERRDASVGGGLATVRVYGWPVLLTFPQGGYSVSREMLTYAPIDRNLAALSERIKTLWKNAFVNSGAAQVLPLCTTPHLHAIMDGNPFTIHRAAFKGASMLEGTKTEPFFFSGTGSPNPSATEDAGGPVALPYLMLCYVAFPKGTPDPVPRMNAEMNAQLARLFEAMASTATARPVAKIFAPQGYFAAMNQLKEAYFNSYIDWLTDHQMRATFTEEIEPRVQGLHRVSRLFLENEGGGLEQIHEWAVDALWLPADVAQMQAKALVQRIGNALKRREQSSWTASPAGRLDLH